MDTRKFKQLSVKIETHAAVKRVARIYGMTVLGYMDHLMRREEAKARRVGR